MKGIAIAHRGLEDVAAREINELISAEGQVYESAVAFKAAGMLDLCLLAYKSQSTAKIMSLIAEFEATQLLHETTSNITKALSDSDLSRWIGENTTFKATCSRTGTHAYNSQEIMMAANKLIKDKTNRDINLDSPDTTFHVHIAGKNGYIGVDFTGIDTSKREYRIFTHPAALKGTTAYGLLRIGEYRKNDTLIDPFTKSGIIPIEAALHATKKPVNFYRREKLAFMHLKPLEAEDLDSFLKKADSQANESAKTAIYGTDSSMPSITAAQKNAKLAGVNKNITFSRIELEWLDTKFAEKEADKIITAPIEASKKVNAKFTEKLYKELFYQAKYILSDKGKMTLLMRDPEQLKRIAAENRFEAASERTIHIGKEEMKVLQMQKA